MNSIIIIIIAAAAIAVVLVVPFIFWRFRHEFTVPEGWAGLVYQHGLYVRRNNAGRHVLWGRGWTISRVDLRRTSLVMPGEEFVLADRTSLQVGTHISCQIIDPAKAAHETQHWPNELYQAALRSLHRVLGGFSYDELLRQRLQLGAQLLAQAQPEVAKIGISIHAIDLRIALKNPGPENGETK